jgi:hypothetical protein
MPIPRGMQRRALGLLSFVFVCGLAGCGGTGTVAAGPPEAPAAADIVPAPDLEPATTAVPITAAPTTAAPVTAAPTTKAPPATPAPTTAPRPTTPPTTAAPVPVPVTAVAAAGGCDPSYPGVCIPPGPPDLDCPDVPFARFTVIGADPHGFDGNDNDGIGCESN